MLPTLVALFYIFLEGVEQIQLQYETQLLKRN